jgi:hypothetical protein
VGLPARLADPWFEAEFYIAEGAGFRTLVDGRKVALAEANGLFLWCPCGYGELDKDGNERYPLDLSLNKGRPHGLLVPFANPPCGILVPSDHGPLSRDGSYRPRWAVSGTGFADLTLQPSIAVGKVECWHGFITGGLVR